jgi:hypothetical protein
LYFLLVCLDKIAEWKGLDGSDDTIGSGSLEEVSLLGKNGGTLQINLDSSLGGIDLSGFVVDLALQDFLLALGLSDVLNTNMDTLFENSSIDKLVDTNTDGTLGDVENNSGSSVVSLVGHTLMNSRIGEDINVVTDLDGHQVLGQVDGSMLPEFLGKHVARTRSGTE